MPSQGIRVLNVVGARPNFMKIAPLMRAMKSCDDFDPLLLHTGQHYEWAMSRVFFEQLELGEPHFFLDVRSGTHAQQTARIMPRFEKVLKKVRPDLVVVVGDVNSTLACALTAAKLCIPVAHVEAGLRSRDRTMPEEINRIVTDTLADYLFTPSSDADRNLLEEGVPDEKIYFVGNIMIDTLIHSKKHISKSKALKDLKVRRGRYALLTLHRPANVDAGETLAAVAAVLRRVCERIPIVFPAHPRTTASLDRHGVDLGAAGVRVVPPLPYFDFMRLVQDAAMVLTDSGGVQEETTFLGVPCLTMRPNTERPVTVTVGTNTVTNLSATKILNAVNAVLDGRYKKGRAPKYWDGRTAERIVNVLRRNPPV